jgi:hypothetical protein
MHPYREPSTSDPGHLAGADEETVLYVLLILIGAVPAILALSTGAVLGVDATLGLLMTAAGLIGLARRWRSHSSDAGRGGRTR